MSFGTTSVSGTSAAYGSQQPPNPFSTSGPFGNLDLTSQQQSQIQNILSQAKSQGLSPSQVQGEINNVLTPDQQQTLQSDLQKLRVHRHDQESSDAASSNASLDSTNSSGAAYTSTGSVTSDSSSLSINTSA
jgi:Spy/CpxP family protein refolding chaperone